jgi:hypothetical protein
MAQRRFQANACAIDIEKPFDLGRRLTEPKRGREVVRVDFFSRGTKFMNGVPLQPILAILAGVLILLRPSLLTHVVALYLILVGILGLIGPRKL